MTPSHRLTAIACRATPFLSAAAVVLGCNTSVSAGARARPAEPAPLLTATAIPRISAKASVQGAWRLLETAVRTPGGAWDTRPAHQGGLYVFSARHYSYFYVRGLAPRTRFADGNRPTEGEKAAAYDSFIAGGGTYTFDGRTLTLRTEFRKNPNEMTGEVWRWQAETLGDTLRFVFVDPPFLPGREWRTTLVRIE